MRDTLITMTLVLLAAVTQAVAADTDSNWPGWRGPAANGHSQEQGLPVGWDSKSITWKTELKGRGHSSPMIWGERIYLTTALEKGKQRVIFCVNRNDGQVLWEKVAWTGQPEPSHRMNGWASPSCTTDGEHVYAFFGKGGLHCYTMDGDLVWSKDLGQFPGPWGTAGCPLIVGNMIVQNCDADRDQKAPNADDVGYITAVDKKTGETLWKTKRSGIRGWSSPILITVEDHDEIVLNGHTGVTAYDPKSGKQLWFCKSQRGRGTATITTGPDNLLYAIGGTANEMLAVKSGGSGDVTATRRVWTSPRKGGRDLPSPLLVGNYLLAMNMKGILTCMNPQTGEILWQERIGGNFSSTPVSFGGLAFFISEAGETLAVKPGPKYSLVSQNSVGGSDEEIFRASITPSDGQVFIRSDHKLYCIGKRKSAAAK